MNCLKNLFMVLVLCLSFLEAEDFYVNCDKCVIDIGFNDVEIEQFKKKMGDDFYIVADDENYYSYELMKYIKANDIEFLYVSRDEINYTNLVFSNEKIKINTQQKIYGEIYYMYEKGKRVVRLKDNVMPQNEINAYFNITNPKYPKKE